MDATALALLLWGVLLAEPVSRRLAVSAWPTRDPVGGLLLWQAIGLAGGLALLGSGVVYGLRPFGPTTPVAVPNALAAVGDGRWPEELGIGHALALAAALLFALRLVGVLVAVTVRTLRTRRRHRDLLDLLATPWPAVPGAHVL